MKRFCKLSVLLVAGTLGFGSSALGAVKLQGVTLDLSKARTTFSANTAEVMDYLVQFAGPITEAQKSVLKAQGVEIFRYVPDNALIVRASAQQLQSSRAQATIAGFAPFTGSYKLSDNLPSLSVFSRGRVSSVVVKSLSDKDLFAVINAIQDLDSSAQVMDAAGRVAVIRLRESVISQLPRIRGVEFVQKAEPMTPFHMVLDTETEAPVAPHSRGDYTDLSGTETGTSLMGFAAAWAQGLTGRGQVVAMADTGLDSGEASTLHPDFAGTVKKGFSYGLGAADWSDPMGHGTHVAGSVMSRGTASNGALRGGAYEAGMIPQGMWSPIIDNLTVPPRLNRLFDAAYSEGARLHTNSWGNPNSLGAYDAMAAQVDDFMWKNPDMLVIFAAGNSGTDADKDGRIDPGSVSSPGTSKNSLTVGASENETSLGGIQVPISSLRPAKDNWGAEPIFSSKVSDNGRGIAMFSSRGPTKDGRIKPDVVAPGTNILSNKSMVEGASDMWGVYNKDYVWSGGTSMATPLTAGAAALVRQALAERYATAQPSAALVKAMLMHTALDLYPGQYGEGTATQELQTLRPNSDQGYGRVDMEKLAALDSATTVIDNKAGLATGEEQSFEVQMKAGQKLLVNLVWTDSPGSPSAAKALVNDLDLSVEQSGRVLAQPSDRLNNSEIVDLEASVRGTYMIRIRGQNVPMGQGGKQPFAVVYSVY